MLAPWKKSYNQPRQHIKKQRHHFANKGPSSQSYGFSSSHVRMWELDYKAECRRIDAFELWCWRRLLRVPWTAAHQASLSTNSWSLFKLVSIKSVMTSNHLILCRPLLLLPSVFPASGSFPMSQLFASGDQSIGASLLLSTLSSWSLFWAKSHLPQI